jgi:hypothetical protein
MKTHPIEGRLRDALTAHAETFSASPDVWQQIQQKSEAGDRPRRSPRAGWLARHSAFVIPAAAAATVVAVAIGATALAHGFSGAVRAGGRAAPASAHPNPEPSGVPPLPASHMFATDPAISAISALKVARNVTTWNWIGRPSPLYWFPYVAARPQACHWVGNPGGGGSGSCWPMPTLDAAHPAVVISSDSAQAGNTIITGLAESAVTSVTAVTRDGRRYRAAIGTARGFGGDKAWSVDCTAGNGTKLVFTGAAGRVISRLSTAAPPGPVVLDNPQPSHGGVHVLSYQASGSAKAGTVTAYLIEGHVAFFSPTFFAGTFSPDTAAAPPAAGGMIYPFGSTCTPRCRVTFLKAFGYAHGNAARVVVRLPGGGQVAADTFQAGWPGSDLRLWQMTLPGSLWPQPKLIATAYDAAGHAIGQAQLGQPQL